MRRGSRWRLEKHGGSGTGGGLSLARMARGPRTPRRRRLLLVVRVRNHDLSYRHRSSEASALRLTRPVEEEEEESGMGLNYYCRVKCGWYIYPWKSPIHGGRTGRGSPGGFWDCYLAQHSSWLWSPGVVAGVNGLIPYSPRCLGTIPGWGCPHGQAFTDSE